MTRRPPCVLPIRSLPTIATAALGAILGAGLPVSAGAVEPTVPPGSSADCLQFESSSYLNSVDTTRELALADLDDDLDLDVVVTTGDGMIVLFNDGQGLYADPSSFPSEPQNGWRAVATGDLDGDGDIDIALTNQNSELFIYMNSGDGTFTGPTTYGGFPIVSSMVLGDVDADDDLDAVLITSLGQTGLVVPNAGDGTFSAVPGEFYSGLHAYDAVLGDMDGDQDLDLVLTELFMVRIIWNDGTGFFGPSTTYTSVTQPTSVAVADVDGDLDLDLLITDKGSDELIVAENLGAHSFGEPTGYGVLHDPISIAVGDIDGDLDPDVAVGSERFFSNGYVTVHLNDGTGGFDATQVFQGASDPRTMAMGDLDGVLPLDLAVSDYLNGGLSVMLGEAIVCECPGELTGDGVVGIDDLVLVILDFGTDGGDNGTDLDGNMIVDIDDLVFVILAWGPCQPGQ